MPTVLEKDPPIPDPTPLPGEVTLRYRAKAETATTATASYTISGGRFVDEEPPVTRSVELGPEGAWRQATLRVDAAGSVAVAITMSLSAPGEVPDTVTWVLNVATPAAHAREVAGPATAPTRRSRAGVLVAAAVIVVLLLLVLWRAR